jgi:predicted hydrocarbon binding protein
MDPIPKSELYFPNKVVLVAFRALEDVLGHNGLNATLNYAHLSQYIQNPPTDDLHKAVDFADFSMVFAALEDLYGPRGARGLGLRIGHEMFKKSLESFGAMAGIADLGLKLMPQTGRMATVLKTISTIFGQISDQPVKVESTEDHFEYTIEKCAACWGRQADHALCHISTGFVQEALHWATDGKDFPVEEVKCRAKGDEVCQWIIGKTPLMQE